MKMIRNLVIVLITILVMTYPIIAENKSGCGCSCAPKAKETTKQVSTKQNLSKVTLEDLVSGEKVDIDLSSNKHLLLFLDSNTISNSKHVEEISNWIKQNKMKVNVYTILSGDQKEKLSSLAKENKLTSALWDSNKNLANHFNVTKYPMALYVVEGKIQNSTTNLEMSNVKKIISDKKMSGKEKEGCGKVNCPCGANCNCGPNCKC
ncbi:MAG: hypothetical protein ABDH21_05745 [bacterium]